MEEKHFRVIINVSAEVEDHCTGLILQFQTISIASNKCFYLVY